MGNLVGMGEIAIRAEHLGKVYRIGAAEKANTGRLSSLKRKAASPFDYLWRMSRPLREEETLWALKDVSFEVKRGEVLGVIGSNGAGKSTLLKILSRITEPSEGRVEIHGRVGSLLEVGTGFHPELTGRENIYLSGTILGMRKAQIDHNFDEIVDFSGVERFLDTPVKRYSSGMNVRLGFAVAAHLNPEILLVDEVLAVGDAEFQKKCLGKMNDFSEVGKTVLFVSHNMGAIDALCTQCMILRHGIVSKMGEPMRIVEQYLEENLKSNDSRANSLKRKNEAWPSIINVECTPKATPIGGELMIKITYDSPKKIANILLGISIETPIGQRIFGSYMGTEGININSKEGENEAVFVLPEVFLAPGVYVVTVAIHSEFGDTVDKVDQVGDFEVLAGDLTRSGHLVDRRNGLVWLKHHWKTPN